MGETDTSVASTLLMQEKMTAPQTPDRPIFNTFEWCRAPKRQKISLTSPSPEAHIFRRYVGTEDFQKSINGPEKSPGRKDKAEVPLGSIRLPPLIVRRSSPQTSLGSLSPLPKQAMPLRPTPLSSPTTEQAREAFLEMREPLPSPNKRFAFGFGAKSP